MKILCVAALFLGAFLLVGVDAQPANYPVQILESGHALVRRFEASMTFYLVLMNHDYFAPYEVTVIPDQCCWFVEENDTDCEVMILKPRERVLYLEALDTEISNNNTGRVTFQFRNMYVRYKKGNCSFTISSEGVKATDWKYFISFNTFPNKTEMQKTAQCEGFDQDPDRNCTVDCAIKYRGKRSFYVNETGKCVPVAECNTRADDGVTITAYYDWETNSCHHLALLDDENSYINIESDTEIPRNVRAQDREYFPELEPGRLEEMTYALNCNHGKQHGIYCVCEEGWISTGIHGGDSTMYYHWCDQPAVDRSKIPLAPRRLSKLQEITLIVFLSIVNVCMFLGWVYMSYRACCKQCCARTLARCCKCCNRGSVARPGYEQVPTHHHSDSD